MPEASNGSCKMLLRWKDLEGLRHVVGGASAGGGACVTSEK